MHADCPVCRSEGFEAQSRIRVHCGERSIVATLNVVTGALLALYEAGLSEAAWRSLGANEGDEISLSHPPPIDSLSCVRAKVYGGRLDAGAMQQIIADVVAGNYSDVHLSAFITACAGDRLDVGEMAALTRAMVGVGERIDWGRELVVDKHSVGGLPGNRTTLIVVPIVAAYGLTMPKTSSRAITSPAGTADAMEVLAPVNLDIRAMRRVVEQEGGCVVWGGAVRLSPADDILIRVERPLDLDSEGQLVASVLSKKVAAGSSHVVIDMPVGSTAKVRSEAAAEVLARYLVEVGREVGVIVDVAVADGSQPVGRGIGPALEARDAVAVLNRERTAPLDLRERALAIAGRILDLSPEVRRGEGSDIARAILEDGRAWRKFVAICEAQGGMREPPRALHTHDVIAEHSGRVSAFDNRRLARTAKLAGAPADRAAGVEVHVRLGARVERGAPLFTIHAEAPGELAYALGYVAAQPAIVRVEEGT
jgi:thymidine phosphorylase